MSEWTTVACWSVGRSIAEGCGFDRRSVGRSVGRSSGQQAPSSFLPFLLLFPKLQLSRQTARRAIEKKREEED